ncbi:MAG TPA: hypothetical protein VH394_11900 [Thermoanaerobaculia bacterium]|jgi:hypothetical protein|nr:hypothetical protein [Thermoanaerobaculia bacterium]
MYESEEVKRVDEMLQRMRAAARQRQAEVATRSGSDQARHKLAELTAREYVQEPIAVSPRPVFGRWIVLARKVIYHVVLKWFTRPVMEQQNAFNTTVSRLVQDQVQSHEALVQRVRELEARLAKLEQKD